MIANDRYPDAAAGSLLGGAIGDALGYAVEFISLEEIEEKYGPEGITAYEIDFEEGQALVSDDTQMTLFTAGGLMTYETKKAIGEPVGSAEDEIRKAYKYGWLPTQAYSPVPAPNASWLMDVPMLWARRAPGVTCMSELHKEENGSVSKPLNQSKGCGGVMRVAPVALYDPDPEHILKLDMLGAEAAAITHGHPMGYIPAAALVHIVHRAAFGGCAYGDGLYGIARECMEAMEQLFPGEKTLPDFLTMMEDAIERSRNGLKDTENIAALGQGWVGDEALVIALYCSLKYQNDFSKAVIAAVNHSGDSDSTGAIAGNIVGALLGKKAIEPKWLGSLEMQGVIGEVAADLVETAWMRKAGSRPDADHRRKYIDHRWK